MITRNEVSFEVNYCNYCNPLTPLSAQKCHSLGGGGGPQIFFLIGIIIFLLIRSPGKILETYDNPFGDFSNGGKKKSEKINLPKIVAYLSCQ